MKIKLPPQQQALGTLSGADVFITATWLEKLKYLETLDPIPDYHFDASFMVTPLTPGSNNPTVGTGAITDASDVVGTVRTYLQYGSTPSAAMQRDNVATLVSYITQIRADLSSLKTATDDNDTRTTALENKVNAIIADLAARFP